MRQYYISFALFVSVFLHFLVDAAGQSGFNGVFFHGPSGDYLIVEEGNGGFLVKRKEEDKWTLFNLAKSGEYFDRRGNRIEIWNQSKIVYVPVRSRRGRVYFLTEPENNRPGIERKPQNNSPVLSGLEGLWYNDSPGIYLVVVETRDGIKARLKDERKWVSYVWQKNEGIYLSDEGNYYYVKDNTLIY